jgi:hypothetical protein
MIKKSTYVFDQPVTRSARSRGPRVGRTPPFNCERSAPKEQGALRRTECDGGQT